jgi:hypothetical protein
MKAHYNKPPGGWAPLYSLARAAQFFRVPESGKPPNKQLLRYHAVRGHILPDLIVRTDDGAVIRYGFALETLRDFAKRSGWQYVGPDSGTQA